MVVPVPFHDWARKLAEACLRVHEEPDGPVWFWRIRARILRYMLDRYGDEESAEIPDATDAADASRSDEPEWHVSSTQPGAMGALRVTHVEPLFDDLPASRSASCLPADLAYPIKDREQLRGAAEHLHLLNEQRRAYGPEPTAADMWERAGRIACRSLPPGANNKSYYCLQCEHNLRGLPSGRCPTCNRPFLWENPMTYTRRRNRASVFDVVAWTLILLLFIGVVLWWLTLPFSGMQ